MKKNLFYLFALICSMSLFTACSDDDKPETPPTVEDIVAEYSADNLKPTIEGVDVTSENIKVELAKTDASDKVTVILHNIVPGVPEFKVPDAEFAAVTRSLYVSTLKGEVTDNVVGYNVKVDGTVDGKVLTVKVVLTEIEGTSVNVTSFYKKVYKGDMDITVSNLSDPVKMMQRVYIVEPDFYNSTVKRDTAMVQLQIKNFAFEGIELGNIKIDTISVVKRGEVYAFEAKERKLKLQDPIGEVTASLKGTIVGEELTLNLDIDALGMLKVNVAFQGPSVIESQVVKMEEMKIEGAGIASQDKTTSSLTLKIWADTPAKDLLLTPQYKISEKGTVESIIVHTEQGDVRLSQDQIDGKQPIDFSVLKSKDDYIKYHMVAEDPNALSEFTIRVEWLEVNMVFDMKEWVGGNPKGLISSNGAAALLGMMGINLPEPGAPVTKAADGATRITTFKTESGYGTLVPAITAGTLFTGNFEIVMDNTLKSTQFGVPYNKKPVNFKFAYKYTPGETMYKHRVSDSGAGVAEVVAGRIDECSIAAYLYEVSNYSETLDGTNIDKSEKVILKAALADGTLKDDYQELTIPFTETGNGTFDASKKYKLAIVCTPSRWGDQFMGADLSSLYVKYLAVE